MGKKDRNNITKGVNSNIYNNNNKEIVARMVREVLGDYRDSFFNLIDDELKNLRYEGNKTLQQMMNESAFVPPLWGSTGYFDPGGDGGSIPSPPNSIGNGIISSATNTRLGKNDAEITISFLQSVANRKLTLNFFTESSNMNNQNDICAPMIRCVSSRQIKVGIREVSKHTQSIRIEVLAFTVQ